MDKMVIFAFITGSIIGSVSMYFAIKNSYQEELDKELEDMEDYYQRHFKEMEDYYLKNYEPKDKTTVRTEPPRKPSIKSVEEVEEEDIYKTNVNLCMKYSHDEDYTEPTPEPIDGKEYHELKPYIIDEDVYFENERNYEQQELFYFAEDGVITNDERIPLADAEDWVGLDNLEDFEGDIIYICNEKLGMMYEVTRMRVPFVVH